MTTLVEQFQLESAQQLPLRFNIAPTDLLAAVVDRGEGRRFAQFRWGLVPFWAKDPSIGNRMINARGETVAEKPAFREAFKHRRCLILADGYFEWIKEGKKKLPYYIRMKDERPFAFAGLWERWRGGEEEEPLTTCTIITTDSNTLTSDVHDRMPVILDEADYDAWLDTRRSDGDPLRALLRPYDSDEMTMDRVSTRVNSVRNDDPGCLEVERELF